MSERLAPQKVPCLRCGDFVASASASPTTVPLCVPCLSSERITPDRVWVRPPAAILLRQARPAIVVALVAGLLGLLAPVVGLFPTSNPALGLRILLGVVLGLLCALIAGIVTFLVLYWPRMHVGHGDWKRALLGSLGFQHAPDDERVALVWRAYRKPRLTDLRLPLEPGLLFEVEGGLAFFGAEGSRELIRFQEVSGAALDRLVMWPPRRALRVDHAGRSTFFAFMDEASARKNDARARSLGERISGIAGQRSADAPRR
jgi:hypothetical protein